MFGDLNLFGVAVHGSDDLSLRDDETDAEISLTTRTWDAWFAQADWVIAPPFQVSLRYENLRPADSSVDTVQALNANFSFLVAGQHQADARVPPGPARLAELPARDRPPGGFLKET